MKRVNDKESVAKRVKPSEEVFDTRDILWIVGDQAYFNIGTYKDNVATSISNYFHTQQTKIKQLLSEGKEEETKEILMKLDALYQLAKVKGEDHKWEAIKALFTDFPYYRSSLINFKFDVDQSRHHYGYVIRVNVTYWSLH